MTFDDNSKASKFSDYTTGIANDYDLTNLDLHFSSPIFEKLNKDALSMVKKYEEKWKI